MEQEILKKLNQKEKKFCDNMLINHNKETFFLGLISGGDGETYIVTPSHAKSILNALISHVSKYEKQFGEIDTTPKPLPSPFQSEDLSGNNKK